MFVIETIIFTLAAIAVGINTLNIYSQLLNNLVFLDRIPYNQPKAIEYNKNSIKQFCGFIFRNHGQVTGLLLCLAIETLCLFNRL